MKLEVHERLALLQLLPASGDYAALKTIRRAKEMITFTPKELEFYGIKPGVGPDGKPTTAWNSQKAKEQIKDIPIDEFTTNIIRTELAKLEMDKNLNEQTMSLYEKFVDRVH